MILIGDMETSRLPSAALTERRSHESSHFVRRAAPKETKRTTYFMKAAHELGLTVRFLPYCDMACHGNLLPDAAVKALSLSHDTPVFCKIDPPSYDFAKTSLSEISGMHKAAANYLAWLSLLPPPSKRLRYLNSPEAISQLLNKCSCKKILMDAGVPVTPLLTEDMAPVTDYEKLKQTMQKQHCFSVFVKPNFASGAAGILAYRFHPKTGREQLYTSACLSASPSGGEQLINTKKLVSYHDSQTIQKLFSKILPLGTIIERWIPKAEYGNLKYDLRILWQFGSIAFITVRQSKSPITNLHLNNLPLAAESPGMLPECLHITRKQIAEIEEICHRAVSSIPGLSMAGIDLLLEKNSKKPYIIEMNGQGDLLYQDIYHENKIYQQQAEKAKQWEQQ